MAVTVLQTFPLVQRQGDFLLQNVGKEGAWKELERVKGRVTTGEERGSIWVFPASWSWSTWMERALVQEPGHKWSRFSLPLFIDYHGKPDEPHLPLPSPAHY